VRGDNEPYEFMAGISRYDMVGDFLGAASLYLSELIFQPGSIAPNHYHPTHEESMFCLEGDLVAVYADENNVALAAGDCFTCEVGIRHGVYNTSSKPARLLAIHPVLNPPPRIDVE
jgi:quercetin dioxygenase-like cupin family protein